MEVIVQNTVATFSWTTVYSAHCTAHRLVTYNRTRHKYCHIFSSKSSKFHSWCADIGTQWGIL